MCIQDIEIMGLSGAFARSVDIDTSVTEICGPNQNRIGLILAAATGDTVCVAMRNSVTAADGIQLTGSMAPLSFNIFQHGDMCRRAWYGIAPFALGQLEVIELVLDVGLARKTGYGAPPANVSNIPLSLRSKTSMGTYSRDV